MATQRLANPLEAGTFVKVLNSSYSKAQICEYRGPFGPKGAHIYRIMVKAKPRRIFLEVREDQLEVLPTKAKEE